MWVVRKYLSATEGAPPRTRVNPDTGVVETTPDDGTTWVEDPRSDPRQNPAYMLPPPTAPDVQCAAAAGMVENVRRVIDGAAGGTTVASIATLLLTLLLIPGIGWMFAAMLLFASSFVLAGSAAVLAAWTEDVYDRLLCVFYDNIDADGKVSWAQLEAVQGIMAAEFADPLVGDILAGIMQMHREVGFTNAGVVYADPLAECDCAPTWCYVWDTTISSDLPPGATLENMEHVPGLGYRVSSENLPGHFDGYVLFPIDVEGWGLTAVGCLIQLDEGGDPACYLFGDPGSTVLASADGTGEHILNTDDLASYTSLFPYVGSTSGVESYIKQITLRGDGVNPFGDDNC